MKPRTKRTSHLKPLPKSPTGIVGLDQITEGGLPKGRPTLICGGPGCGKTLFGIEFLVRGIVEFNEPGVFMAFEETAQDLAKNVASLGFDLDALVAGKKLSIDWVRVERNEIEETGEYDLEGLFVRLGHAIDLLKAKRVVLDTIESLFSGLANTVILRAELRRLFNWLKEKGVTAVITGERGDASLTRQGLEEYVSDCVIMLDNRVINQISTRRLRIVKYRGSTHGANEYPFLIDADGISVLPITSLGLAHGVSRERVPSGNPGLDEMFGGRGFYRGSSVMISGPPGAGKTTLAATFIEAACRRGERCMLFGFEESEAQILRNMASCGLDLQLWANKRALRIFSARPTLHGLEMHLAVMHKQIDEFKPSLIVVDPVSTFVSGGNEFDVSAMLMRLIDFLKTQGITFIMTSLVSYGEALAQTGVNISSLIDVWILLQDIDSGGERNHLLYIMKARGQAHSNQVREYTLGEGGLRITKAYLGAAGVLTGSARLAQEAKEKAGALLRHQEVARREAELTRKRKTMEAQVAMLEADYEAAARAAKTWAQEESLREKTLVDDRLDIARSRKVHANSEPNNVKGT